MLPTDDDVGGQTLKNKNREVFLQDAKAEKVGKQWE
jgi:hypothetical protein